MTAKRPKTVIEHIIKHGSITTEELKEQYGYNHAPRAARDVREQGIPLETFKVRDSTGRSIAAYRFAKWKDFRADKLKGRLAFPKQFKEDLADEYGQKCHVCYSSFEKRYLQIDHRVPYEVGGDTSSPLRKIEHYMLVCASCNRAKSWSCEHCSNWKTDRDPAICIHCYWASPLKYKHIAMSDIRRLAMTWQESEVAEFDKVKKIAAAIKEDMPEFVKQLLRKIIPR